MTILNAAARRAAATRRRVAARGDAGAADAGDAGCGGQPVLPREGVLAVLAAAQRLSDLRRLVRQYGRTQDKVFPTRPALQGRHVRHGRELPGAGRRAGQPAVPRLHRSQRVVERSGQLTRRPAASSPRAVVAVCHRRAPLPSAAIDLCHRPSARYALQVAHHRFAAVTSSAARAAFVSSPRRLAAQHRNAHAPRSRKADAHRAADYAKWETLGSGALSPDGKWVAYDFRRGNASVELRYRAVDGANEHSRCRRRTAPQFTSNSRWLLYTRRAGHRGRRWTRRARRRRRGGSGGTAGGARDAESQQGRRRRSAHRARRRRSTTCSRTR